MAHCSSSAVTRPQSIETSSETGAGAVANRDECRALPTLTDLQARIRAIERQSGSAPGGGRRSLDMPETAARWSLGDGETDDALGGGLEPAAVHEIKAGLGAAESTVAIRDWGAAMASARSFALALAVRRMATVEVGSTAPALISGPIMLCTTTRQTAGSRLVAPGSQRSGSIRAAFSWWRRLALPTRCGRSRRGSDRQPSHW